MKNHKLINISFGPDDEYVTKIYPFNGLDTVKIGVALASATRVAAGMFLDALKLDDSHRKEIETQIAEVYNRDLKMGDMGEKDTTRPI